MFERWGRLRSDRRGATTIEYGLILSLIVIAIMVALLNFADAALVIWHRVDTRVVGA